jgi:hypothetical protein
MIEARRRRRSLEDLSGLWPIVSLGRVELLVREARGRLGTHLSLRCATVALEVDLAV